MPGFSPQNESEYVYVPASQYAKRCMSKKKGCLNSH